MNPHIQDKEGTSRLGTISLDDVYSIHCFTNWLDDLNTVIEENVLEKSFIAK